MCSATVTERRFISVGIQLSLLFVTALAAVPLAGQQADAGSVPFKIRRAGEFIQRKDSTGARTYVLRGDVLITHDRSTISCQLLTYFPDAQYFRCTDSVFVSDEERALSCDTLYYYVEKSYYRALGSLHWSSGNLHGSGLKGEYWRDTDLFRVTGDAYAADSSRVLRSRAMEYSYTTEVLLADGDVHFTDGESGSEAVASGAIYNSGEKLLVLRGRPVLTYYEDTDSLREDPFRLTGDMVTSYSSDSLVATGRVRLWQDSLTVTADSLFHDRDGQRSFFRGGTPRIEHPDYRLRSDVLDVYSQNRKLRLIDAVGSGRGEFWSQRPDSTVADSAQSHVSWIEGDSLQLFFSAGAMDSISAVGSARSYYNESEQSGVNYVQGGMILLVFKQNKLDVVEVGNGGSGVYLPPDSGGTITVIPDSAGFVPHADSLPRR